MKMTTPHPNSLENLKKGNRFRKGQSGNPAGRSKSWREVETLARQHGPEAIETLVNLMRNGDSDRIKLSASEALLARGLGKPRIMVDENVKYDASNTFIDALRAINAKPRVDLVDGKIVEVATIEGNAEFVPDPVPKTAEEEPERP
jgi:hypothetical protein